MESLTPETLLKQLNSNDPVIVASGLNQRGTPNLYGSVIEMKYPNGNVPKM